MTENELRDKAYLLATGNHLTEDFTYEEYQKVDISEHLWELTEDWPIQELEQHITQIAEMVINLAKEYKEKYHGNRN